MILDKINSSSDIKKLTDLELNILADEIRSFLIKNISKTGGHLAANLGVVELTLAIHKVFDVDYDKVVWDVGHQSYTHKILTGRKDKFEYLRKFDGISGFPKTEETEADAFNTGHSSTSISAAVGFAVAAKIKNEKRHAIAVIGDGALTGGMAFEALNHAGAIKAPVIVILNDNGMSISQNVGGLSQWLKRIRTTCEYYNFKSNVKSVLDKIPVLGSFLKRSATGLKNTLRPLVVENEFFENFGFKYLGPVNGHDVAELQNVFTYAKKLNQPVVIHVHTTKGKGYTPAEKDPRRFHGVSEFNMHTGKQLKSNLLCWSEVFAKELCALAEQKPEIIAITAAMPSGTGLDLFKNKYPDRFFDVGIAEQHAVTFAAGAAKAGLIPCFAVYSTFLQRGYDQLLHDIALQNLHAVFCIDHTGPVSGDGETHQGVFDISYISHIPGFTILSPSCTSDLKQMIEYAFLKCCGPIAVRYPKGLITEGKNRKFVYNNYNIQNRLLKDGNDIVIFAIGKTVEDALEASSILEAKGISTAVVDVGTIKPINKSNTEKYSKGKKIIATIEDNVIIGGFGQQLASILKKEICIFGYPDEPLAQGSEKEIKIKYGLSAKQIAAKLQKAL